MKYDVIVIGGGAAGCMAAGTAAGNGRKVLLIERNPKICRKVMITGKGRCNVTNSKTLVNELVKACVHNGKFMYSSFSRFMPADVMDFFEELGVPLKIERGDRVFPVSDKAVDIVDALRRFVTRSGATVINERITDLGVEDGILSYCADENGNSYFADRFIIATGGKSYPLTGSTGDGYILAEKCGHTVTPLAASLVPLETDDEYTGLAQGLSLKNVGLKLYRDGYKLVYEDFGGMLFTHFGVSGPMILSASSMMNDSGDFEIFLDLKPGLDDKQLDKRLLRDFEDFKNRDFENALSKLLPSKIIPVVVKMSGIDPQIKINSVTKAERRELANVIKNFRIHVKGKRQIDEAVVTSGGVNVKEIDPSSMRSKIIPNLYFAGEIIDVDAVTGGYNLQIAWSTGRAAGLAVSE